MRTWLQGLPRCEEKRKKRKKRKAHIFLVPREHCCSRMIYFQTAVELKCSPLLNRQLTTGREKGLNQKSVICKENDSDKVRLILAKCLFLMGEPWCVRSAAGFVHHIWSVWFISSQLHCRNRPLLSWSFWLPNYFQFVPYSGISLLIFTLGAFSLLCFFVP